MPPAHREPGLRRRTRVFMVCSGLGNVRRGYEAFMRDCFDAVRDEDVDVWLFKGAGADGPEDISLGHLPRSGFGARVIGELSRRGPYVVEQASFALRLIPCLIRGRPDVVYYCDPTVGKVLRYWRRISGAPFRLLFHNGGPHPEPFRGCDHVHQLTPGAAAEAVDAGCEPHRQTLLPCGLRVGAFPPLPNAEERAGERNLLGLPTDRPIVLSVGALNRTHKRMDYLIEEIAALGPERPFLLLLGEPELETPAVQAFAELLLGSRGFEIRTVDHHEMSRYYRVADVFALASLTEAFGLSYAESLANGLPTVAHDYPVTRFVLDGYGRLGDFRRKGALAELVQAALIEDGAPDLRIERHRAARDRFGWNRLAPDYVAMMERCARGGRDHVERNGH